MEGGSGGRCREIGRREGGRYPVCPENDFVFHDHDSQLISPMIP